MAQRPKSHQRTLFYAVFCDLCLILFLALLASGAFALPDGSGGWIYAYQTLLSAIIAGLSIWIAWRNYNNTLKRKEYWARAHLPDALSDICRYAEECFHAILDNKDTLPKDCDDAVRDIKNAIECVDEKSAETLFKLVSFYQTQKSRLRPERYPTRSYPKYLNLYSAVLLYAKAERIFDYARNETAFILDKEPQKNRMMYALCVCMGVTCIAELNATRHDNALQDVMKHISFNHT